MSKWTIEDMPNLKGKIAIVTGGNKGLGYRSTLEFAKHGATVVIGCRDEAQGLIAKDKITKEVPNADIDVIQLDLLDKSVIEKFAHLFIEKYDHLDILLNNAGVVNLEFLRRTEDGREMHMATNHLGHFMLTGLLLPVLKKTDNPRIVTISSGSYKFGVIDFEDFDWKNRPYDRSKCYGDSKLANMLFMRGLQSRFDKAGIEAVSLSAHPGLTGTERQQTMGIGGGLSKMIASPIETGFAPFMMATTYEKLKGKELIGPKYFFRGHPVVNKISGLALDDQLADALWSFSEKITGIQYDFN